MIKVHTSQADYSDDSEHLPPYPYGYPIHARCWDLLERLLGPRAEDQLGVLLRVLRRGLQSSDIRFYDIGFMRGNEPELWIEASTEYAFAFRDPVKIPALREVIDESLERRRRESLKRRTRRWCPLFRPVERLTTSRHFSLDMKYTILDLLDCDDVVNVLSAFGWEIPDEYWCRRLRRDLLFELDPRRRPAH
jgi:hypothetical protein